jgi:DNA-binding transcriptional regulator GbsR (MarR family)
MINNFTIVNCIIEKLQNDFNNQKTLAKEIHAKCELGISLQKVVAILSKMEQLTIVEKEKIGKVNCYCLTKDYLTIFDSLDKNKI